jgi:hypothetical protein
MRVHSNTIERTYAWGETFRRRVTMVDTDYKVGDVVPQGLFWAGWTIVEIVEC